MAERENGGGRAADTDLGSILTGYLAHHRHRYRRVRIVFDRALGFHVLAPAAFA